MISWVTHAQRIPVGVIASSQQSSGSPVQSVADQFKTATGITGSNANAIDSLVKWLQDSSLWSLSQVIYPVIGGTEKTHSYNLVDTATFKLTFNGTWTHNATGMAGNGSTGYAVVPWNPTTQVTSTVSSMGIYTQDASNLLNVDIGAATSSGGNKYYQMYARYSNTFYCQLGSSNISQNMTNNVANGGWFFSSRTSSSAGFLQKGTAQSDETYSDAVFPNVNLYIGAQNASGTASYFTSRVYGFVWLSNQSLTKAQSATLYRIVQKYETLLSRQQMN